VTTSSSDVVNQALELIATQNRITALNDGTPAAVAANTIYAPTVSLMLRAMEPDFARKTATLTLSAAVTPVDPWSQEYLYPSDCLRVLQVRPLQGGYDNNNPKIVRWMVQVDTISAVLTKVILANQIAASATYITSSVTEDQWDFAFMNAVVRRLANPLAMALSGRPDFARELLEESSRAAMFADAADESMIRSAIGG
jgi:hypothetical protein